MKNDLLAKAIAYLGAVEVAPGRYAFKYQGAWRVFGADTLPMAPGDVTINATHPAIWGRHKKAVYLVTAVNPSNPRHRGEATIDEIDLRDGKDYIQRAFDPGSCVVRVGRSVTMPASWKPGDPIPEEAL